MHEYSYYGRGNTIRSPGQIEWFQNTCDDKSFHVGGKQVINFLDGYSTPLQCRTGLMYMSLLGQPTDDDLNTYPHVLLTGPHEWHPSIPTMAKWFSSCMSIPIMVEATPSALQVKLNGSRTHVMTNPSMWEGNKLSTSLMAILPLSNVGQVSCI